MYYEGRVRSLGISNYDCNTLRELLSYARVKPSLVQNKYDPYHQNGQLAYSATNQLDCFTKENIIVESYSTLSGWPFFLSALNDPHVEKIGEKLGKTTAQVLLRWM